MTASHNLRHRRAIAAAQRRAPVPQLQFDPFPGGGPGHDHDQTTTDDFGGFTNLFPPIGSFTITAGNLGPQTSSSSSSTSSTVSSASTSSTMSSTSISATPSQTTPTLNLATPTSFSTTAVSITTLPAQTALVTVSRPLTSPSSASAAAASATSATSSGISTGAVVGGIAAAIVGLVAVALALTYFVRRARTRDDGADFDAHNFRRSGMPIDDPPTQNDPTGYGFNPRPPTMIERHLASPAPTFGTQYGRPGPAYNHEDEYAIGAAENHAGYGTSFQSYAPGQIINMNNSTPSPISATSAQPMLAPAPYTQSPFSPVSPQYPAQSHNEQESAPYPAATPVLTRQGSAHSQEKHHQPGSPSSFKRESAPANDYVDLSRSSVSPFQAAQYVEISRRLNTDVPAGLPTADIERELPPLPPKPETSPFADPASAPPSPGGQYAIDRRNLELNDNDNARPVSGESMASHTLEFPVPPSPAHSMTSSRYRIDSMPPTLPEIHVESRVSVGNYPGLRNSGAVGVSAFSPGLSVGMLSRFPTTPSPLASSFGFPSPTAAETSFGTPTVRPTAAAADTFDKKRNSMHSLYDAEDAYGGI